MNLLRLICLRALETLRSGLFGDDGGVLCFVTRPINDSDLLELVAALARASAREDHRKFMLEREATESRKRETAGKGKPE